LGVVIAVVVAAVCGDGRMKGPPLTEAQLGPMLSAELDSAVALGVLLLESPEPRVVFHRLTCETFRLSTLPDASELIRQFDRFAAWQRADRRQATLSAALSGAVSAPSAERCTGANRAALSPADSARHRELLSLLQARRRRQPIAVQLWRYRATDWRPRPPTTATAAAATGAAG
jgi:hypothetical protein